MDRFLNTKMAQYSSLKRFNQVKIHSLLLEQINFEVVHNRRG